MSGTVLSPLKALFYKASQKPYTSIISIFKNKKTESYKEINNIFS